MANKVLKTGLIIIIVAGSLIGVVLYSNPILQFLHLENSPSTTPPTGFISNETKISLANQTKMPPLKNPSVTILGGEQYANLQFKMNVNFNGSSYEYSNLRFAGSVWNFTGSSLGNYSNIPVANQTQPNNL